MKTFTYQIENRTLKLDIPNPKPDFSSFFIFSAHKSGSTLLNNLIRELCSTASIPVLDIPIAYFRSGIAIDKEQNAKIVSDHLHYSGFGYLGARTFWCKNLGFDFSKVKKILLVRDPRDAIISWYFSDKKSHTIPDEHTNFKSLRDRLMKSNNVNEDIEYLNSRAASLARLHEDYKTILNGDNIIVYRYEDVIFRKRLWLEDMNQYLSLGVDKEYIKEIANRHDVMPDKENSGNFIRQVRPGNYIKHFSPATIELLNERLDNFIRTFRYDSIDRYETR